MKYLHQLATGLEVAPILAELSPELWDAHKLRTSHYSGAHSQVSDIWLRYRDWRDYERMLGEGVAPELAAQQFVCEPHESVWYQSSYTMPRLRSMVFELMRFFGGERLGGILITRIAPGAEVKPHVDGGWHASYYEKLAVQLKANSEQAFCFEDGEYKCEPGALYSFNNNVPHWVSNHSADERMTLFICLKRDVRYTPLWSDGRDPACLGES